MRTLIIGAALLLAVVVTAFAAKSLIQGDLPAPTAPSASFVQGSTETIVNVRMPDGYTYVMDKEIPLGSPVRLVFDMKTVQGCMRNVVIPAFGIRKTVSESDNTITFTPERPGVFKITCSMGMGKGTFTVIEPGTLAVAGEPLQDGLSESLPGGGSCGMGGCGCGMRASA